MLTVTTNWEVRFGILQPSRDIHCILNERTGVLLCVLFTFADNKNILFGGGTDVIISQQKL